VADLIVIGYPDETTADAALEEVERLQQDLVLEVEGAGAVVRHADGKVKVHAPGAGSGMVGGGALWGGLWGGLFGLIFLVPFFGAIVGGAFGALFAAMDRSGIDREFREKVQQQVAPGTSALVLVVDTVTPDQALEALSAYRGTVIRTSLSEDAEKHLQEALAGQVVA
jgi:uncharacterized membrane protein